MSEHHEPDRVADVLLLIVLGLGVVGMLVLVWWAW